MKKKNMTKAELDEFSSTEYQCMVYTMYHENKLTREQYASFMTRGLEGFIKKVAAARYHYGQSNSVEYEDLVQACYQAILTHLDEYDPTKGFTPSTFFNRYFKEFMGKCYSIDGTTRHYKIIKRRMDEFARKYGFSSSEESGFPPEIFAENLEPETPLQTILKAIEYSQRTICTYSAFEDNVTTEEGFVSDQSTDFRTPETILCEQEMTDELNSALSALDEAERYTVIEITVNSRSFRDLCMDINESPELLAIYAKINALSGVGKITQQELEKIHSRSLMKMKSYPTMQSYQDRSPVKDIEMGGMNLVEEETERDIEYAFASGINIFD